jgi:hypothetical protein
VLAARVNLAAPVSQCELALAIDYDRMLEWACAWHRTTVPATSLGWGRLALRRQVCFCGRLSLAIARPVHDNNRKP